MVATGLLRRLGRFAARRSCFLIMRSITASHRLNTDGAQCRVEGTPISREMRQLAVQGRHYSPALDTFEGHTASPLVGRRSHGVRSWNVSSINDGRDARAHMASGDDTSRYRMHVQREFPISSAESDLSSAGPAEHARPLFHLRFRKLSMALS